MSRQSDLFTALPKKAAPGAVVTLKISGGKLSPEQVRFNKLVARVESLNREIAAAKSLGDLHRPVFMKTIPPLQLRCDELLRAMVLLLDQRVQQKSQKGLTEKDRQSASDIICTFAFEFAQSGDAAMKAIFDAHSDQSLDEIDQEEALEAKAMFEELFDGNAPTLDPGATTEEILRAGAAHLREFEAAQAEKRNSRKAKRAKATREQNGSPSQDDPETVLRTIYRQLASKLHPDREMNPDARDRKTALMSQANAAYEKRDLMTLLGLQLTVEQLDSESISGMAKEKMAALTHLLKEQVQTLEHELHHEHGRLMHEFDLSPFDAFDPDGLTISLSEQAADLKAEISQMEYDIDRVRSSDGELKRWLKEQRKLMKQSREISDAFHVW
jgi:hypothetical protein